MKNFVFDLILYFLYILSQKIKNAKWHLFTLFYLLKGVNIIYGGIGMKFFKKFTDSFKSLEKKTCIIMKNGIKFCFLLCILSCIVLLTYTFVSTNPITYYIGFALFELSISFMVDFVICGFVVDGIKKQVI